jgi:TonB family protein
MSESWKRWEGRTVDGKFPLQSYLGASDHSAVFLTLTAESEKAAIKLILADPEDAEKQLLRWNTTSEVTHPNLIHIFAMGRCELDGTALLYVVMEYAEENLSQILPERALTAEEAGGMLPPILRALQAVHDKGYAHGHIQPSNILAIGDEVKLSSDTLSALGDKNLGARAASAHDSPEAATGAASQPGDVWQVGMTVVEVLTQRLPVWDRARMSAPEISEAVPQPFHEIAEHCLRVDAGQRGTAGEILERLGAQRRGTKMAEQVLPGPTPVQAEARTERVSANWRYLLLIVVAVAGVFVLFARRKPPSAPAEVQPTQSQPAQTQQAPTPQEQMPSSAVPGYAKVETPAPDGNGIVMRVIPQVSPAARRTIQGKIKVRVRINVDDAGNVTNARFESAGPSKYFSRIALEAARDWKFSPAQGGEQGREWRLEFAFSRAKTEASAVRARVR